VDVAGKLLDVRISVNQNGLVPALEKMAETVAFPVEIIRVGHVDVRMSPSFSLLKSFKNLSHEREIGDALEDCGMAVSLSHEIFSKFREYERTSTKVINACVVPRMQLYIGFVTAAISDDQLRIMPSNGGSISVGTALNESVRPTKQWVPLGSPHGRQRPADHL